MKIKKKVKTAAKFDPSEVIRVQNFLSVNTEERIEIFKFLMEQFR
jgi:hypothetical protein